MSITGSEQWMYSAGREFYDFPIEQSLRFNDNDSAYLSRTPASAGTQTTYTLSMWFKYGNIKDMMLFGAGSSTSNQTYIRLWGGANQSILWETDTSATTDWYVRTNALLRDPSTWYHLTFVFDNSLSGITNKAKIYINGELASIAASSGDYPSGYVNAAVPHYIGRSASTTYTDGYMAEVNFIDGQALDPTSFGEFKSGIWTPRDTSGLSYGTNGFRLQFGDTTEASGFNAVTYTGNGGTQAVSGVGFQPDFVWIKNRTQAYNHTLVDSVRDAGGWRYLESNTTNAEGYNNTLVSSLDADGFSVGSSSTTNGSGNSMVAWAWDAGSGSAASNTDGSITSTVKANNDYGFSIASFTGASTQGATFGHGLDTAPSMVIAKARTGAQNWFVYHSALGYTKSVFLNLTNASATDNNTWRADPTSSLVTIGDNFTSSNNYIAYCFAEKTGYSKFGSFTGTGAAGNSITLGFKPAFLLIKETGNANSWELFDNTRNTSSPFDKRLFPNSSQAEATTTSLSYSDTGFETLNGNTGINRSGGTYIYMAFADTRDAAFWRDTSGQGNDWQPNNLVFSDVVPDAPSNNFNTFSSVIRSNSGSLSEGNLKSSSVSGGASNYGPMSSYNVHSGKWYFEFRITGGTANDIYAGAFYARTDNSIRFGKDMAAVYNGKIYADGVAVQTGLANPTINDVFGFAVDVDNSTCQVYRNGSTYGTLVDFSSSSYISNGFMGMGHYHGSSSTNSTAVVNYGQDSTFAGARAAGGNADENGYGDFAYAPPSGFLSLCSANLPTGAIDTLADETPEDYFNTVLYTGNSSTNAITGVGFQPDWTWIKNRSGANSHILHDVIRGNNSLSSNLTNAEINQSAYWNGFNADGFEVTGTVGEYNASGSTYASWNWKAGGTGVSNTDGSITSTVSVSETSQGVGWFSVVGFTTQSGGYTVGHGLGQKPSLIITKNRDTAGGAWYTFTDIIDGSVDYLALNQTSAKLNDPFGLANPTSSVFSLDDDYIFGSGDCIAYCFADAENLCKVGSYVGNGSTDGVFVATGHRPSFVMIKRTDGAENWLIYDNRRDLHNVTDEALLPNSSSASGGSANAMDMLSNGFKFRSSSGSLNASGGNYIFLSISEQPFKYANAR